MICYLNSRRAILSTAVVVGSLFILSGCKHFARSGGVQSSGSGSYLSPYDNPSATVSPALNEPLPELTPVPPLPGAGHSVPPEPLPPPPVPPAPSTPTSALPAPEGPAVSQTRSLWDQFSDRMSVDRPVPASPLPKLRQGRHAAVASAPTLNRTTEPRLSASALGNARSMQGSRSITSTVDDTVVNRIPPLNDLVGSGNGQPIESVSSLVSRDGGASSNARSGVLGSEPSGLVITPLQQPLVTGNGVIEDWPYHAQPSAFVANKQKIAPIPPIDETPTTESSVGSIEQTPAISKEEATVPSLLPPGP